MTNVSFGSRYKMHLGNEEDCRNHQELTNSLRKSNQLEGEDYATMVTRENKPGYTIALLDVKNGADLDVERYCAAKGIDFARSNEAYAADDEIFQARMKPSQNQGNLIFTTIDSEKLTDILQEKFEKESVGNAKEVCENPSQFYKDSFYNSYEIQPASIILRTNGGKITGANIMNTDTYAALVKRGIKDVPVLMDNDTHETCKTFNVLS